MLDATTMLPDGRTLAYTEVGAPDGPVVFYFHGAPGGRLEMAGNDEAFAAAGIRVLTADRPGYGRSSPQHGRTTADWADDVDALAEHLGVERFAVMGLSSGGPYTMACAARLPDRVTAAVIAAGNTDMSWPDLVLGEIDDAFLADEINLTALMTAMAEAFRQGVIGYAHDITVQGRPWTFDLAAITAPVLVVHGADDRSVPVAHSDHRVADPERRAAHPARLRTPEPDRPVPGTGRGDRRPLIGPGRRRRTGRSDRARERHPRSRPPWSVRMEPCQPLHGMARRAADRAGRSRGSTANGPPLRVTSADHLGDPDVVAAAIAAVAAQAGTS